MLLHAKNSKIIEKALLKSIVPYLTINSDWAKGFTEIARVSTISYAGKSAKQKKAKCLICAKVYQNILLFLIHLQLTHKESIEITKYEFCQQNLVIYSQTVTQPRHEDKKTFFSKPNSKELLLLNTLRERIKSIFNTIFSKFVKTKHKQKRIYFHSTDIFRQMRPQSEDEDSEAEIGLIQRDLQKMRIGDFSDVNQNDKNFFIKWNDSVYKAKKQSVIIDHQTILKLLCQFAVKSKEEGIKRINLVIHGWTLWSTGKISAEEVSNFLLAYDQAH